MSATSGYLQADFDTGLPSPAIASIDAVDGKRRTLLVRWAAGKREGRVDLVDLAPLIGTHRFYIPLRNDPALFETAHLIDDGYVVAWGDDAIDMSAASVERLAVETMTGADFYAFLAKHSLTHQAAAAVLGRSKRQIEYYLRGKQIPRVVALACFGYEARRAMMASDTTTRSPDLVWRSASSGGRKCFFVVWQKEWRKPWSSTLNVPHHGNLGGYIVQTSIHPASMQVATSATQSLLDFRQWGEVASA